MKSLFVPIFVVLTATAHAGQFIIPPVPPDLAPLVPLSLEPSHAEIAVPVTHTTSIPLTVPTTHTVPTPHTVERVTEATVFNSTVLNPPPERFGPILPSRQNTVPAEWGQTELGRAELGRAGWGEIEWGEERDSSQRSDIYRGQARPMDGAAGILDSRPSVALGPVPDGTVDPNLIKESDPLEGLEGPSVPGNSQSSSQSGSSTLGGVTDPVGYWLLLFITAITTIGLVWMIFVAYDYRQRWMQTLTGQNDRYLGSGFDMEWDSTYSGGAYSGGTYSGSVPLYEGYGLSHRSI